MERVSRSPGGSCRGPLRNERAGQERRSAERKGSVFAWQTGSPVSYGSDRGGRDEYGGAQIGQIRGQPGEVAPVPGGEGGGEDPFGEARYRAPAGTDFFQRGLVRVQTGQGRIVCRGSGQIRRRSYDGPEAVFPDKPFLKEFVLKPLVDLDALQKKLYDAGFFAALKTEEGYASFCVTEKRSKEEIDTLVNEILR